MPSIQGDFFSKSVVFIYDHNKEEGSIGFTINKPLSATLGNVLEHLQITVNDDDTYDEPVFSGGPLGPDQGFILHDRMSLAENKKDKGVTISTSKEILEDIANGHPPDNFLVTLGYAGWEPGQLEEEILRNDWLIAPMQKELLFTTPIAQRWVAAAKSVGVDVNKLSGQIGHA